MQNLFKEIDQLQLEINAKRPLDENLFKQIKEYYRIGITYSSNALEGNTLTESETKIVLEEGITIGGKPLRDHLEAQGLSEAYDFMYNFVTKKTISEEDIKKLHRIFYFRIDEKNAGVYRLTKVFITGSKYPTALPQEIPNLMKNFVDKINDLRSKVHPVELAAIAHKEFVFMHPFVDGNGIVARLLMNLILMQESYNIVVISPILRAEYIRCLEKAHKDDEDFIKFIAQSLKETQKDYIRLFLN